MATDLGRNRSASTADYENRVEGQLARAEKRIRTLDLAAALLTFAAGTLAYAVVAALLDHWLILPPVVRQAGLIVYLLAAAAYLTAFVILPLSRRINPYFAARQLERTLPDAKNSVVNWLDLREQNLPPAIRGAVGQRAARAVAGADPDKAVSARRAWTAGGVAAVCAVAFLVALFTVGFGSFFGGLGRIFSPFGATGTGAAVNGIQITIVKPVDDIAVVSGDQAMDILVRVDGRAPDPKAADALTLQFRYEQSAPYQQRPLEPADGGRWGVSLPAADIHDGFWYKVTGGGAETNEHRVRLAPRVLDFKAAYTFRPYTARAPEKRTDRRIEALRGTEVDVTVHTNRDVMRGWLQLEGASGTTQTEGQAPAGDPQGFTVRLTLDATSQYRIGFTSREGENFIEPQAFPLIAVPDKPPVVTLTQPAEKKPGWVAAVHEGDLLPLDGVITDDVGVAAARLNLKVGKKDDKDDDAPLEEARSLPPQEYRSRDALKLPRGGNPITVDYKDFVDLEKLKPQGVQAGMVLEYWLTAEDACDYPDPEKPNVGESKHYRARIVASLNNPEAQNQQRTKAESEKKDAENRQDQQIKDEDQKRQEDNKRNEQGNPSGGKDKGQPKPGDKPQDGGKSGDSNKPNPDQGNNPADSQKEQKKVENATDQVRKAQEGSGKSDPKEHPADAKDGGQKQQPQKPGESKDGGGKEGAKDASQRKDGPQNKPGDGKEPGQGKDQGRPDSKQTPNGEAKAGGDPKATPDAKPGEGKDGQTEAAPQPSESKDGGKPDDQKQAGGAKPQGGATADQTAKAENKGGNPSNPMGDAGTPGEGKDKPAPDAKAETKPGPDGGDGNAAKSEGKSAGKPEGMNDPQSASAKDGGQQGEPKDAAQPKPEGKAGSESPSDKQEAAKNLDDAFKQLQDGLKSKDPERREEAEEFLRRYMTKADDPRIRDRAKKTLADAGLNPDERPLAAPKPQDDGDSPPQPPTPPAEGKSGSDKDAPQPKETPKEDEKQGESKGDGQPPKDPMKPKQQTPPATAKDRQEGGAWQPSKGPPPNDPQSPANPETPLAQPKGLLQLYNFWQRVPKDVLKDALADSAQQKVLEKAVTDGMEDLFGPQHGGPLNSMAGTKSNPDAQDPNNDPNNGGRVQPPPGYINAVKDFSKFLPGGDNK